MRTEDLERFAHDLRTRAGLEVEIELDSDPAGLHILRIHGVDFFFHADGTGYDGWGKLLGNGPEQR